MSKNYLGIDLGGSNLKIACRVSGDFPDFLQSNPHYNLKSLGEILSSLPDMKLEGIGVSCAGDLDYEKGVVRKSLRLGTDVPLAELVGESLGRGRPPIYLINDAQSAALAELHFGVGLKKGRKSFLFINLGSNPGAAVVLNDHLLINPNGRTLGRVGHLCLDPLGPNCRCGKKGCWDTYLSAKSVMHLAETKGENLTPVELSRLAQTGDGDAKQIWQQIAYALAQGTADLSNFLGLDTIVIGGGLSLAGDALFEPLSKRGNEISRFPLHYLPTEVEARKASVFGATILAEKGHQGL